MKIKYISLNIWLGGILIDAVLDFIRKEKPDILALQEVYNGSDISLESRHRAFLFLKGQLKDLSYSSFAAEALDAKDNLNVEIGNAVFSRFPIVKTKVTFFDQPYGIGASGIEGAELFPRNIQHATLDANGTPLNVFNTHGIWGMDGKDNPRRLLMAEKILEVISGHKKVILSGDFNMDHETKAIGKISNVLTSVFKTELASTFNMKRKENPGYRTAAVDMMFVSPDIGILEYSCPQVDISDHLPLVSILEV